MAFIASGLAGAIGTAATTVLGVGAEAAATIGAIGSGAIIGAGVGAAGSAITGGDPGKGALFGGLLGGVGGAIMGPAAGAAGAASGAGGAGTAGASAGAADVASTAGTAGLSGAENAVMQGADNALIPSIAKTGAETAATKTGGLVGSAMDWANKNPFLASEMVNTVGKGLASGFTPNQLQTQQALTEQQRTYQLQDYARMLKNQNVGPLSVTANMDSQPSTNSPATGLINGRIA